MTGLLEELEARTSQAYWSDGLLDLLVGVALVALGVSWIVGGAAFGGVAPAILVPLWKPLRQRFTIPRLGRVELSEGREARNRKFLRLTIVAGTLSLVAGVAMFFAVSRGLPFARQWVPGIPGVLVGLLAIATAEALELRRFFVYGALCIASAIAIGLGLDVNPGWAFFAGGLGAVLGGSILATRFVKRYPRQPS
jgi:hypothetical protein